MGDPSAFNKHFYFAMNPDVQRSGVDAEEHYRMHGEREGRWPNPFFDPVYYAQHNPDINQHLTGLFTHYQKHGCREQRQSQEGDLTEQGSVRILFVGHEASLTGAPKVLFETIRYFFEMNRFDITVVLLEGGHLLNSYKDVCHHLFMFTNLDTLRNVLKPKYRCVFLNTVVAGKFIEILHRFFVPIPDNIITYIHELGPTLERHLDQLQALQLATKHWITVSEKCKTVLVNDYRIPPENVSVVFPYIDLTFARKLLRLPSTQQKQVVQVGRQELGIPDSDAFVIINCGTVDIRKGVDLFVETAKKVLETSGLLYPIYFVWIGHVMPESDWYLDSMTEEEKQRILFVGMKPNARDFLAVGDIFFLTSREDPHPLVVLEASAVSVPTVCFEQGTGITDFLQTDTGVRLPSFDTDQACRELLELLHDTERREAMGRVAHERVMAQYDTSTQVKLILSTISQHIPNLTTE